MSTLTSIQILIDNPDNLKVGDFVICIRELAVAVPSDYSTPNGLPQLGEVCEVSHVKSKAEDFTGRISIKLKKYPVYRTNVVEEAFYMDGNFIACHSPELTHSTPKNLIKSVTEAMPIEPPKKEPINSFTDFLET